MFGRLARTLGKYAEEVFFEGDNSAINPMRYIPTPFHTKMWQERTAYSQYLQQEASGTRMRRWERPIHDFLAPYFRGLIERTTDTPVISAEVEHRRDLDTLTDMLGYLRSLKMAGEELEHQVPPRSQHICSRTHAKAIPLRTALGVAAAISSSAACLIARPQHIYVSRTRAKAARLTLHSRVLVWISPLRRPGNTSFPTSTSTSRTPPHGVHGCLPSCCLGVLPDADSMFPAQAPEGIQSSHSQTALSPRVPR
jgi:hypothetical protein